MIATIKRLLDSRKAVLAVIAGLSVILVQQFGLDQHVADVISGAIVTLACAFVGATGYEDAAGKARQPGLTFEAVSGDVPAPPAPTPGQNTGKGTGPPASHV